MGREIFSNKDLVRYFNMTPRQANHWTELGLISCIIDARGTGSQRGYDIYGVFDAGVVKSLFDLGLNVYMVKSIMTEFTKTVEYLDITNQIKEPDIDDKKDPIGVLLYYFMRDGSTKMTISLKSTHRALLAFHGSSFKEISQVRGLIILDVGSILVRVYKEILKDPRKRKVIEDKWQYNKNLGI